MTRAEGRHGSAANLSGTDDSAGDDRNHSVRLQDSEFGPRLTPACVTPTAVHGDTWIGLKTISADLRRRLYRRAASRRGSPIRVAVTGTKVSPPIDKTLALLGREATLRRLDAALARL